MSDKEKKGKEKRKFEKIGKKENRKSEIVIYIWFSYRTIGKNVILFLISSPRLIKLLRCVYSMCFLFSFSVLLKIK